MILRSLSLFIVLFAMGASSSEAKKTPETRLVFVLDRLDIPEKGAHLEAVIRKALLAAIQKNDKLLSKLPARAPTIDIHDRGLKGNKRFRKFMENRSLRAFRIVVQLIQFEADSEENPTKPGNIIDSSVKLRIFGETMPDRVMAFTGDGAAHVRIEVGTVIRPKDREFADRDAIELAIAEALTTSLNKLAKPSRKGKKRLKQGTSKRGTGHKKRIRK